MTVGNGAVLSLVHSSPTEMIERPNSPDIMLGAYLVSHLRQHCENCGTLQTPQWRKGWHSDVLNHSVLLCNACGLKFHKNQFCPYCKYVYGKEQKITNIWLTCEYCTRWVHVDCETQYGGCQNNQPYACPDCRNGTTPTISQNLIQPNQQPEIREIQNFDNEIDEHEHGSDPAPVGLSTSEDERKSADEMQIDIDTPSEFGSHHAPSFVQQH